MVFKVDFLYGIESMWFESWRECVRKRSWARKRQPDLRWVEKDFGSMSSKKASGVSVAVVYPGFKAEGMSSLAVHALVRLIGAHPGAVCEPIFALEKEPCRLNRTKRRSISSSFDLLAFSVSFEEQWFWIPKILEGFGIPVHRQDRRESYPVVMVGGLAARLNPNPVWPFIDLVVPGEAEVVLHEILDVIEQGRGVERRDLLRQLGEIRGVTYTGGSSSKLEAVFDDGQTPVSQVMFDSESTFRNMFLIETGRGCPMGCRFCAVSFSRRPAVFFGLDKIMDAAREGIERKMKIGLVGASLSRHPQLMELIDAMSEVGADVSPASLHPGLLGTDVGKRLLDELSQSGQRSVTLAPETGSERLRLVINKPMYEEELHMAVCRLAQAGILHLKLYLMYGLPTEQPEDIRATIMLVSDVHRWMVDAQRSRAKVGRLSVSINPFVPKPHTPFENISMPALGELRKTRNSLIEGLKKNARVQISGISPKRAMFQWLLSRGGQEMSRLLENDVLSWPPPNDLVGRTLPEYLGLLRGIEVKSGWSDNYHVDVGLSEHLLTRERQKAFSGLITRPCLRSVCLACKGCIGLT